MIYYQSGCPKLAFGLQYNYNCINLDIQIPFIFKYDKILNAFQIFGWDCLSDSQYTCALDMTEKRIALGKPVLQYNGRVC